MSQKKAQLLNPLNGNLNVSGVVTASSFSGDGSGLTGVASTDNIQTATPATFLSDVSISGVTTVGVVTSGTSLSASQIYGDVITATSGIDAIGIQSGGIDITTGIITAINLTGSGNTLCKISPKSGNYFLVFQSC